MRIESIHALIIKLNSSKNYPNIHLKGLGGNVDLAMVWDRKPKLPGVGTMYLPVLYYLIKNENQEYIGVVLDMKQDLHWYLIQTQRGKGYLTKALKQYILPHIFQNRDEQYISINSRLLTIKNFEASQKVAFSVGFVPVGEKRYVLKKESFISESLVVEQPSGMSEERLIEIKKAIKDVGLYLLYLQTEIETRLGNTYINSELKDLIEELKLIPERLHENWWELERAKKPN